LTFWAVLGSGSSREKDAAMPLDTAEKLALIAAVRAAAHAEILPRFRQLGSGDIATKSSANDLVTSADLGAEAHIRREVAKILPSARIVGEEGAASNPMELDALAQPGITVVIDAIDGTWNFAHGLATFGTLLAVIEDDATIFALLFDPVGDDYVEASLGEGAWLVSRGRRISCRLGPAPLLSAAVGLHHGDGLTPAQWTACAAHYPAFGRMTSTRASIWDYRLLISGGAQFCLNQHLNVWDHAAGVLALTEAGGHAALIEGAPYAPALRSGYLLAAQSEEIWQVVADRFSPALPLE